MKKAIGLIYLVMLLGAGYSNAQPVPRWKTLPAVPAMEKADSSGLAAVNGARLYFAIFNQKGQDPVVLLHGGFGSSEDWAFEVPRLAVNHTVIVVDTRGHGRSTMSDTPFSYELFASDLSMLKEMLRIPKASIVGWSDGGITGLIMAIKYPAQVKKLFTYGANYNMSGEKNEPPDTAVSVKFMARVKQNYQRLSPNPGGFAVYRERMIKLYSNQPDLDTAALRRIHLPVVIGCGEYEQFHTLAHFESLSRLIPGAKMLVLPAVSHGGPWQDPAGFHRAVAGFLDN